MSDIKLIILDDYPIVVAALTQLLGKEEGFKVVGGFNKPEKMLTFLEQNSVDLILLEIEIRCANGLDLCKEINRVHPLAKILILSNNSQQSVVLEAINKIGVSGYILKNTTVEVLFNSVRLAVRGEATYCDTVKTLISKPIDTEFSVVPKLTKREKEILKMVSEGKTSIVIAEELSLSSLTIDTHRKNIMNKFKAKNSAELTTMMVQRGVLY